MSRVVLVCGGRDFSDWKKLYDVLDREHYSVPISLLVHGAAPGADTLAGDWARSRLVRARGYPAQWKEHGRRAGPIRNAEMLADAKPDIVIAFPGGVGTNDMTKKARKVGVQIRYIAR